MPAHPTAHPKVRKPSAKPPAKPSPKPPARPRAAPAAVRSPAKAASAAPPIDPADTPVLRLIALLEVMASGDRLPSLQSLVDATGLPKPTVHRMLQQLEGARLLQREGDGRHYSSGTRLRRLAENLLLHNSFHGARHAVLRRLVDEVGESCNITALSGDEVMYLDRVETAAPLRFYLHPGSRVPAHCSASGKMLLSQFSTAQRQRLLSHAPLERCTPHTRTTLKALEADLAEVKSRGYALDDEEFLPGLYCVAVAVPVAQGLSNLCVAVQGPVVRFTPSRALKTLPALRRAAQALSDIEQQAQPAPRRTA